MATKQELEALVEELQKKIADNTPVEVQTLKTEVDVLKSNILELESDRKERDALTAKVLELESINATLIADADVLQKKNDYFKSKVEDLQVKLKETPPEVVEQKVVEGDSVVLSGIPHVIIRQDRVVDMITAWRGRYINDDDLVILVQKA